MSLLNEINNAKVPPKTVFGRCFIEAWECALVKGQGKVPFDPAFHAPNQRAVAVKILIVPTPTSGLTYNTEREAIASSHDFAGITLPSIHALNATPESIHEKWVQVEMAEARKYTDKNGVEKTSTMPRFVAIFNTEAECDAAAAALFGSGSVSTPPQQPATNGAPANNGMTRDTALKFLPGLLASAKGDPSKAAEILSTHNLLKNFFDINSPEVIEILTKQVA